MGIEQIIMMVVIIGGVGGYWWWTTGRHGADATKVYAGLQKDEQMAWLANGYFQLDFEKKDVAMAMVGVERRGKAFTLAGTQSGELVLRPRGDEPVRFQKGQLRLQPLKTDADTLVGLSGQPEPADVFEAQVQDGEPFKVLLARSVAATVNDWSAAA